MLLSHAATILSLLLAINAHYTFTSLIVNGSDTPAWMYVRKPNNFDNYIPIEDVTSPDLRCYTSKTRATAKTTHISAGSTLGFVVDPIISHPGVLNVYMAKSLSTLDVSKWNGDGKVWFKVNAMSTENKVAEDGSLYVRWPTDDLQSVNFTIPRSLPNGQYLVRIEHIALHLASQFRGAQFYVSCGQIDVSSGGNGTPGPLVSIPGLYTGREPGIMLNILNPIPLNYTQPGPVCDLFVFHPRARQ